MSPFIQGHRTGAEAKGKPSCLAPNSKPHSAEHVPGGEARDAMTQEMRKLIQRCEVIWNKYSGTDSTKRDDRTFSSEQSVKKSKITKARWH